MNGHIKSSPTLPVDTRSIRTRSSAASHATATTTCQWTTTAAISISRTVTQCGTRDGNLAAYHSTTTSAGMA